MRLCIKMELKKALSNKFFIISIGAMALFALLSAISVTSNYQAANTYYRQQYAENGAMTANEQFPTWSCFSWWIGAESQSLVYSLFFTLMPVFAVLPHAASYHTERKSGYLRNILTRTTKKAYFCSKLLAVFSAGALVAVLPLLLNFTIVSAFMPIFNPQVNYNFYNHVPFGSLWADLFYSAPLAYTGLYILLCGLFAGLFALLALAISFYIKNRFVILFLPFLLMLGLDYLSNSLVNIYEYFRWTVEFAPTVFLHAAQTRFNTVGWVVLLEAGILAAFAIATVWMRGKRHEVF